MIRAHVTIAHRTPSQRFATTSCQLFTISFAFLSVPFVLHYTLVLAVVLCFIFFRCCQSVFPILVFRSVFCAVRMGFRVVPKHTHKCVLPLVAAEERRRAHRTLTAWAIALPPSVCACVCVLRMQQASNQYVFKHLPKCASTSHERKLLVFRRRRTTKKNGKISHVRCVCEPNRDHLMQQAGCCFFIH